MQENQPPQSLRTILLFVALMLPLPAIWAQPAKRRTTPAPPAAAFEQVGQRAAAARQADKLDEALRLYQQGVHQKPSWVEGWWALGTIYYQLDRYTEGRAAFQRLVALEPKGGVGWAFLGLCEYQCRDYANALLHLQRARELGLGASAEIASVAKYHTAILLNKFAQFEMAFTVLSEVAKAQKESPALLEVFGLTMLRMAYLPTEIPADQREVVSKMGRAAWLGAAARRTEAQQEYGELLAAFPRTPNVHYAYGVFLLRDAPDEAIEAFKKEIELVPTHVFARLQIAFEAIKRNEHATGLPYAEAAVKLAPDLFATHNALGRILLEVGQTARAIQELELGVKQAPTSPEMHFALARAYAKAGRKADADRARADFMRLDKIRRAGKENMVGDKPETKPE